MAGGPSTPRLAAAVSEAGGLGFLAAGNTSAAQVAADVAEARSLTTGPLGVNLFVIGRNDVGPAALEEYRRALEPEATRLGAVLGDPTWDDDGWAAKVEVLLDVRPEVASFTWGCPDAEVLGRLAAAGVHTTVTVTTAGEAQEAVARGAASVCVQSAEAGGHRGSWDVKAPPDAGVMLEELLTQVMATADVPVVAAGGISDAAGVQAVLARGAVAAQVGTALLLTDEAGTRPLHRAALADPDFSRTALTRAFTGRWARGLANRFMREHPDAPAACPEVHHLTAPLRAAAFAAGDAQSVHLWAGTGFRAARGGPAGEVVRALTPSGASPKSRAGW